MKKVAEAEVTEKNLAISGMHLATPAHQASDIYLQPLKIRVLTITASIDLQHWSDGYIEPICIHMN